MSALVLGKCLDCSKLFEYSPEHLRSLGWDTDPKRCQTCRDLRNPEKDYVTISRHQILGREAARLVLPTTKPFRSRDGDKNTRLVLRGNPDVEGVYNTRIDIYSSVPDPMLVECVAVRVMVATQRSKETGKRDEFEYIVLEPTQATRASSVLRYRRLEHSTFDKARDIRPNVAWYKTLTNCDEVSGRPIAAGILELADGPY